MLGKATVPVVMAGSPIAIGAMKREFVPGRANSIDYEDY
jgi:hypothetical protein